MTVSTAGAIVRATDTHANRPAANTVAVGTLYPCTTHGIIYRSDGSTWANWAVLPPAGGAAGQVLTKNSGTDGDWAWTTPSSGAAAGDKCRAYPSADVTLPNTTVTVIPLNAETFDSANLHDLSTNNSRITIASAGDYLVTGRVEHSATSGQVQARLHKNGAQHLVAAAQAGASAALGQFTDVLALTVGDYLELAAFQASGSSASVIGGTASTYLAVKKLP